MEKSFSEYRKQTESDSDSDSEFIDNSYVENVVYSAKKKPTNYTVFVAESEESASGEQSEDDMENLSRSIARGSSAAEALVSSDDDRSRKGSIRRDKESPNRLIMSSSDEEELSPEMHPKRRPPVHPLSNDSNESIIVRRTKKRMILLDSDTDNSIILEHTKGRKQTCLKDTPLKIDKKSNIVNASMELDDDEALDDDTSKNIDDSQCNDDSQESERINKSVGDDSNVHETSIDKTHDYDDDDENSKTIDDSVNLDDSNVLDITKNDEKASDDEASHAKDKLELSQHIDELILKNGVESDNSDVHETTNDKSCENYDDEGVGNDVLNDDEDEGPDEDLMVMSRATRMSILGVIPKDDDESDADSDFIQSDESSRKSDNIVPDDLDDLPDITIQGTPDEVAKSTESIPNSIDDLPEISIQNTPDRRKSTKDLDIENSKASKRSELISDSEDDLPEVTIHRTPSKNNEADDSKLTCSPFDSPLHDLTNDSHRSEIKSKKVDTVLDLTKLDDSIYSRKGKEAKFDDLIYVKAGNDGVIDLCDVKQEDVKKKVSSWVDNKDNWLGDDVAIIESKPEVIALSSDDEDETKPEKKSLKPKKVKSPSNDTTKGSRDNTIKQYLVPASYPNQVMYVKKNVRENELMKLQALKEDLNNVRHLLEEMDMNSLPDRGARLIERHSALEAAVRQQGDKVTNMVVEPDNPTSADMAKDGFDTGLSWDDLQKASNAVQPRMFGRQAMATHMAERYLILDSLRDLHASLASRPADSAQAAAPRALAATLMPHQRQALAWLLWRETQNPRAGILADDMGLGKTITMIALVASDKDGKIQDDDDDDDERDNKKLVKGGTLVVCPASLIQQWAAEVGKHCRPHALAVGLHHGPQRATQPHRLATYDIVATTYNILQRDSEKNGVLMRLRWRRVVLDEAHIVRNHKAVTSRAVCALRAARRWCLTGTPVQNKDLDLFALLKFLRCAPFDDLQMWKKWIDNKSLGGQERLSTIMRSLMLRRTKLQLQQKGELNCLPDKHQHVQLVTLDSKEMNVYQKVLVLSKTLFAQFLHQRAEKNSGGADTDSKQKDSEYYKMHKKMVALQGAKPIKSHEILVLLLRLRQVCCHCGLISAMLGEDAAGEGGEGGEGGRPDDGSNDLLQELDKLSLDDSRRKSAINEGEGEGGEEESATAAEAIRSVLSPRDPVFQMSRPSSKIQAVMECLENNVLQNKGDKAVVVSQWTSVLSLVERQLKDRRVRSVTLSGVVPVTARPALINAVNDPKSDVKVMLLSLCAGAVGINLCGANHLLLLDPHWNPQLEEQAQDRIYRVGQLKDVNIYRFVCVDTVEQSIRKLQEAKLQLAENVLTGARNAAASSLSIEDLKMLFNMGPQAHSDDHDGP